MSSWLMTGKRYGVTLASWTPEARTGRFSRGPERAKYWSGASASSYATDGMASELDRRIGILLEQEKFTLLTSSASDIDREQYVK